MSDKAPERIWLQTHMDDDPDEEREEVTWAEDQIGSRDVQYIRLGLYETLQADNQAQAERIAGMEENSAEMNQHFLDQNRRIEELETRLESVAFGRFKIEKDVTGSPTLTTWEVTGE